ncbi:hypothetical protein CTEN210_03939 [Chaetoceros tenuissimus]|uniref:Uncharacterized protein n=1 Tax=Chaetoceros tenuissimus TaxID=426638 RepID=A0AAD3H2G9_9STRA|nr:hypothetical protein CTEN210_03939 [Chaetoceros tenuissimus]
MESLKKSMSLLNLNEGDLNLGESEATRDTTTTSGCSSVADSDSSLEQEYNSSSIPSDVNVIQSTDQSDLLAAALEELQNERARRIQLEIELAERPKSTCCKHATNKNDTELQSMTTEGQDEGKGEEYLYIVHKINSLFTDNASILKRNIDKVLLQLFDSIFQQIVEQQQSLSSQTCPSFILKNKHKRIQESVDAVLSLCDPNLKARLTRKKYDESTLKPVLMDTCTKFANSLRQEITETNVQTQNEYNAKITEISSQINDIRRTYAQDFKTLTMERDEYLSLVNALTCDNRALVLSAQNEPGTLPLYQTRLLEISPWDERAQSYMSAIDEVYQWQCYDEKTETWSDQKILHTPIFQSLPIGNERNVLNTLAKLHYGNSIVEKACTDINVTHVVRLEDNPESLQGSWTWANNWSPDLNFAVMNEMDSEGWVYSKDMYSLMNGKFTRESSLDISKQPFRRRKLSRKRVLVGYPGINPSTRHILALNKNNAQITTAVTKLSHQINDMQHRLIQKDEDVEKSIIAMNIALKENDALREEKQKEIRKLEDQITVHRRSSMASTVTVESRNESSTLETPTLNLELDRDNQGEETKEQDENNDVEYDSTVFVNTDTEPDGRQEMMSKYQSSISLSKRRLLLDALNFKENIKVWKTQASNVRK